MSVVGFDFGNESCIVAVARQRVIDVVLNDESKRETPAIVCFDAKRQFIGTAGAASTMMNPKISITEIKRLIGRKFSDPELQRELKSSPFTVTEGPDGYPLIHARYLGENMTFTPTQILAMVLSDLKGIAEKNLNAAVVDSCVGIPVYFTDLQRRAVLDAATIAGLYPLRLIHETTATALAYGIYKTDLPENDQLNVAFVDIGHASMQVCIAGFKKGQLKILSHAFDRSLGGRDFDEALFQHFAAKVKEEYKIDVLPNAEACLRLRAACEKLKKVLSANTEAPLHVDCLMDGKDVWGFVKRDEFEQICIPILERAKRPLEKALADAGLTIENVHMVEMVGSSSHVPAIIKILADFFKKEPRRTMNASECVARGCALECAIISPTFKGRDFQIGPFQSTTGERSKVKVKARLNLHGIVSVESATLYEEEKKVEVPVSKETPQEANKMETNEPSSYAVPPSSSETDVNMQAAKGTAGASGAENGVPESGDKPAQMEADSKNSGSLDSIEPGKYILEKEQSVSDSSILAEIDRTMKKHADNLLRVLDGVSARLTQLESRTRHLENSMDDLKISVGNNHESTDGKMKQLENILREWVDGSSVVMDAEQLEEMNTKLEELDTRISLLDEVVSEKIGAIERQVADFGENVKEIEQRVEEMVDEMERKEVKHYGWKCWMVAVIVFMWCLVKFA